MSCCLIYIHIGKTLPSYIYDSIYQTLVVSKTKIYVLIDDTLIQNFLSVLQKFNTNIDMVNCIPLSILNGSLNISRYSDYVNKLPQNTITFRDNFWISTTSRFFYIEQFIKLFCIQNAFHIENDVMLYEDLNIIKENVCTKKSIYMVQDCEIRVVPSIIFIPNITNIIELNNFILEKLETSNEFLNDMNLLGMYKNKEKFPFTFNEQSNYIFDGAAIGQYLGGVDPNNLPTQSLKLEKLKYLVNPSKGFINETCDFKVDKNIQFFRKPMIIESFNEPIDLIYGNKQINYENKLKQVANLHIHSKQLSQFSSIFNVKYTDIITGDRILGLVDFIISTPDIYNYHKNTEEFVNKFILVTNFENVNVDNINKYFNDTVSVSKQAEPYTLKLFIYTHILDNFIKYIYQKLSKKIKYIIYLHNSDHIFGESDLHKNFILDDNIKHVYAQNLNLQTKLLQQKEIRRLYNKVTLLPIGLANSMFKHGDLMSLYTVMSLSYKFKKNKSIYININGNTFPYRKEVLNKLEKSNISMTFEPKPFKEYLEELSNYKFCLCLRGNGIDTHRFYESICLGTIPVIINNKYTNMLGFTQHLKKLGLPFYEITDDSLDIIIKKYFETDFFNEQLYNKIKKLSGSYNIQCIDQLKIAYYI
jgi:hypothetical protein